MTPQLGEARLSHGDLAGVRGGEELRHPVRRRAREREHVVDERERADLRCHQLRPSITQHNDLMNFINSQ